MRRLLALLLIGAAHFLLLWWGDILSTYAVIGLVVLLPSTWLPRRAVAILGPALILVSLITGDGRISLTAGLFLTGSALVRYGFIDRLPTANAASHELRRRELTLVAGVLAVVAVPLLLWQATLASGERVFSFVLAAGGLVVAAFYVCALLALLTTRVRPVLVRIFAPLGRMALTNYLTATILVQTIIRVFGLNNISTRDVVLIAAGILTTQWLWSTLWLRRFTQGPLEWLWRWATWTRRPPFRITRTEPAEGALGAEDRLRRVR